MKRMIGLVLAATLVAMLPAPTQAQPLVVESRGVSYEDLLAETGVKRPLGAVLIVPAGSLEGLREINVEHHRITKLQVSRMEPLGGTSTVLTVSVSPQQTTVTTLAGSTLFIRVPEKWLSEIAKLNGKAARFIGSGEGLINGRRVSWALLEVTDSGATYEPGQQYWVVPQQVLPRFRGLNHRPYRMVHQAQWSSGAEQLHVAVVVVNARDLLGFRLPPEAAPTLVRLNLGTALLGQSAGSEGATSVASLATGAH